MSGRDRRNLNRFNGFLVAVLFCIFGPASSHADSNAAEPSAATKVTAKPVFTRPIIWIGTQKPPEPESTALLAVLDKFTSDGLKAGIQALEQFVSANPNSAWAPSVRTHLAEHYRHYGRYTVAIAHWDAAWNSAIASKDSASQSVATRALVGWTQLLQSLGRVEQLDELFAEAKRLGLDKGAESSEIEAAQEALALMKTRPEASYRCGTFALSQVMAQLHPEDSVWKKVHYLPSPDGGFRMSDLVQIAATNDCPMIAAIRPVGDALVVPSVIHWKLDHYAAILERSGNSYRVADPTFGRQQWLDADTINAETSGHFLVPKTNLPTGWLAINKAEASQIRGKGGPNSIPYHQNNNGDDDPDDDCPPPPPPPAANDGPGGGKDPCATASDAPDDSDTEDIDAGMAQWRVSEPFIALWLEDVPLFYRSSTGQRVKLKLSYNHMGATKPTVLGGFGDKWECNWIGFLAQDTNSPATNTFINHLAGGGQADFTAGQNEYSTSRRLKNGPQGIQIIETAHAKANSYGSSFSHYDGTTYHFLTNRTDAYGHSTSFGYQNYSIGGSNIVRLTQMTDRDGKITSLAYTNAAYPGLITSVTDPYSRTARFFYDASGRLTNITDTVSMRSSFTYGPDGSITNLHTDYGNTGFRYFTGANSMCALNRAIEVTEATGARQLYVYRDQSAWTLGDYDTSNYANKEYRNSFHWNRQQYAALSETAKTNVLDMPLEDYWKGSLKHWLHGDMPDASTATLGTVVDTLSASAGPVVDTNRLYRTDSVAYEYAGQVGNSFAQIGTSKAITSIRWKRGAYDAFGNQMDITRNDWGRPTQFIYYRNGSTVTYSNEFNADGRTLLRVWGPNGEMVRGYGYDPVLTNLLTSVTNALGEVIRYTHDSGVRVTSITQPSGLVTTNLYYTSGDYTNFLQTRINLGFRTNSYSYLNGNLLSHTNELGLVKTFTWDNLNRRTSIRYPDGTTVSNIYNLLDVVAAKDRSDHWSYSGYNQIRQLVASTNANSQVTQYDYCNCGTLSSIIRWNGGTSLTTGFTHDLAGRRTSTTFPDGYVLNYFYSPPDEDRGGPIRVEDSAGLAIHYGFADYNKISTVGLSQVPNTSPDAYLLARVFDQYGRVAYSFDRNAVKTVNSYDVLDRLTNRVIFDNSSVVPRSTNTFTYTSRGLTNSTDALGHMNSYVLDALGRILSQTNANNEALQFTYNAASEMLALTDGKNQTTTWHYDEYGRVTNKLDAASNIIFKYAYNARGHLTNRWTPAKGNTGYSYDPIGNLTSIQYPVSSNINLAYDGLNRLTNMVDATGTNKYSYNAAGQLLTEDGPWSDDTVSYSYSNRRRVGLSMLQPNADPWNQSYAYDQYARLTNVTSQAGSFGYGYSFGIYVPDNVTTLSLPGDTGSFRIQNSYDELARLTSTTLSTPFDSGANYHSYEYDNANQRTRQTFKIGNYVDYTYDPIGQLKTARGTDYDTVTPRLQEQFGYAYDKAGNLNWRTNNALIQAFNVNNLNELTTQTNKGTLTVAGSLGSAVPTTTVTVSGTGLSSGSADLYGDATWARAGAAFANGSNFYTASATDGLGRTSSDTVSVYLPATNTFVYDLNGNLRTNGTRIFDYDDENQLTRITEPTQWKSEFIYDGFMRRRIRKEFIWLSAIGDWQLTNEVHYVYDGNLVIQERWLNFQLGASNLQQLVTYTRGNDLSRTLDGAGGIGGLLARSAFSTLNRNSPQHACYHSDRNGNITALVGTNGVLLARYEYDPFGDTTALSGPLAGANLYRFSSKETHSPSGLLYYLYRYYAPGLQRWINRDPIGELADLNTFRFVVNSPVSFLDLLGLVDINLFSPNDPKRGICKAADLRNSKGEIWVAGHGFKDGTIPDASGETPKMISPKELAERIKKLPKYKEGTPIRLENCYAGKTGTGSFAEKLSKELPTNPVIGCSGETTSLDVIPEMDDSGNIKKDDSGNPILLTGGTTSPQIGEHWRTFKDGKETTTESKPSK